MTEPAAASRRALARILEDLERDTTRETADAFVDLIVEYFSETRSGTGRVSTAHSAADLAERFGEPPPEGRPVADVLRAIVGDVLSDSNRLTHPRSMGQQVSAPLPIAVWTEALTAALNQSVAVWEMSPVGTAIETCLVRWMCTLAGFGPEAGGTFTSGGTEATFAALLAARQAAMPDAWRTGVGGQPPVVVCGEHAHYSVARAAGELGLGTDRVVVVPSRDWRMDVSRLGDALDRLRLEGQPVMAVVATAGSTATGSFDDLDAIGRACDEHGIWLHVDGAHGASALLSPKHRHRLAGIQRARSLAWDPHKMMLMPLAASAVLVRRESDLEMAFSQSAPYLFHASDGRRWDQGLRSFTCSRRADALKLWVALQRHGVDGFAALYEHLCDTARTLHTLVTARPDFRALHEPEANILCFRYVGSGTAADGAAPDEEALDAVNFRLREEYNRAGDGWITTTVLGGRRVLRATIMNPRTTSADLQRVLDGLARVGASFAIRPR